MLSIANHQGNVNQKHNEVIASNLSEWPSSKRTWITNTAEDVEKRKPSDTVGGNINRCSPCGKQYGGFSKKLTTELPYDPAYPLLGIHIQKGQWHQVKEIHEPNVRSGIISNCQDTEATEMSINWWMDKDITHTHTHTMEHYSAIKIMKYCIISMKYWNTAIPNMDELREYHAK